MKNKSASANEPVSAEEALKRLKEGNKRYAADNPLPIKENLRDQDRRNDTVDGQKPWAIVLTCADSRVAPELIFDTGIGELFVIRVAGNIANTSSIASIEYAVHELKTQLIVVLGHQNCGAVKAALTPADLGYNLNHLLAHLVPAVEQCKGKGDVNTCVKKNAELQCKELLSRSSIIRDAEKNGKLEIVDAYYNLTGKVDF